MSTSKCFSNLLGHVPLKSFQWPAWTRERLVERLMHWEQAENNVIHSLGSRKLQCAWHSWRGLQKSGKAVLFLRDASLTSQTRDEMRRFHTCSIHSVSTGEISTFNLFIQEPFNVNFMNERKVEKWEEMRYTLEITLSVGQYCFSCGKT